MKYQQPTFSAPVSNGKISVEEYEVRVGLRCPQCGSDDKNYVSYPCSLDRETFHNWHDQQ